MTDAIGLDIGGTRMRVARISSKGEILDKKIIDGSRDSERAMAAIEALISEMDRPEAAALGVGVPGRVDARTGAVLSGGFLDLSGVDVKARLERRFGRPVAIANDCSMALVGEARAGAARGLDNVVMLTIGTGIGGAAMLDGRIVNGRQAAGQLGHLVVREGGRACVCGQSGCVEMYSSGTALGELIAESGLPSGLRCEELLARADQGDDAARAVLTQWASPLRAAINTLSATFDPDVLLLGGGLGHCALQALRYAGNEGRWYHTDVRAAELGDDAGVIGAGLAALELARLRPCGKRVVMVNGVPASGKSRVSHALSERTGWPVLALDTIKNPFLAHIDNVDRLFNRTLGKASYQAIWDVVAEAPDNSTFIIDAWFGFQPLEQLDVYLAKAGVTHLAEVWCAAPGQVLADRYRARLADRLPGHPGEAYVPELIELAAKVGPAGRGPVFTLDTTLAPADDALTDWVRRALREARAARKEAVA